MELWQIVAIVIAAIVILEAIGWLIYTRKRSERLRGHFGPEYDRRVTELHGDRRSAESELTEREARVQKLKLRPLSTSDRSTFVEQWRIGQARFVDDPVGAVNDADQLVSDIMHARGYTIDERNDRVADLCAAYPTRASDFREANDVLIKHRRGTASTEDLRRAFVHFRSLFDEMLGGHDEELRRVS
jgi:hypothetical protein